MMKSGAANNREMVFVVDDDLSVRESLCWLLDTEDINTRAFASADSFLDAWSSDWVGCITVDIRMPGKNGLQLQETLNSRSNLLPIIVLTGHADVPIAIRAMKLGAFDFLEKPYSDDDLLSSINAALKMGEQISQVELERNRLSSAVDTLTSRECEVMYLVVEGNTNKSIANRLGISDKTVEVHRSRVMEKTGAKSLSGLVRICLLLSDSR